MRKSSMLIKTAAAAAATTNATAYAIAPRVDNVDENATTTERAGDIMAFDASCITRRSSIDISRNRS